MSQGKMEPKIGEEKKFGGETKLGESGKKSGQTERMRDDYQKQDIPSGQDQGQLQSGGTKGGDLSSGKKQQQPEEHWQKGQMLSSDEMKGSGQQEKGGEFKKTTSESQQDYASAGKGKQDIAQSGTAETGGKVQHGGDTVRESGKQHQQQGKDQQQFGQAGTQQSGTQQSDTQQLGKEQWHQGKEQQQQQQHLGQHQQQQSDKEQQKTASDTPVGAGVTAGTKSKQDISQAGSGETGSKLAGGLYKEPSDQGVGKGDKQGPTKSEHTFGKGQAHEGSLQSGHTKQSA